MIELTGESQNFNLQGAGYKTLLLVVYKTSLFSGGPKCLGIRPHDFVQGLITSPPVQKFRKPLRNRDLKLYYSGVAYFLISETQKRTK